MIKEFKEYNSVLELAQITSKTDFFYQKYGKIMVKGGGSNSAGTKEHNPPHVHLEFNDVDEIRIVIPNTIDDELISLDIELNSKIKKDLKKWFNLTNSIDKSHNNYEMMKILWDFLNNGDDNVSKFSK